MGQRHLTNLNPDIDLNRRKLRKRRTMIDLHQDLQSTFKMEVKNGRLSKVYNYKLKK